MSTQQSEKVAVVSGAGSGIGAATAVLLGDSGVRVVVGDIDLGRAEKTTAIVVERGGTATAVQADAADADATQRLVDVAMETYGGLDMACNNAGMDPPNLPLLKGERADWQTSLDVNLSGTWLAMRSEIEAMLATGRGGSIVNVSSIAGLRGIRGETSYAAAKHGVIGLTCSAALDYARKGVRINAVCPGPIDTPMLDRYLDNSGVTKEGLAKSLPQGRLGTPDEVARAVRWLLSDESSFVTGHALAVDGGYLAK
ncbi:MAG: hypothetical protein ABS81_02450 [Pseudonocardia sp. SCN 72-86]|nr:MAG: hypothetical protein ABS81_02450 [Pseudonocardia sp. SCN 72-86]